MYQLQLIKTIDQYFIDVLCLLNNQGVLTKHQEWSIELNGV